MCATVCAASTEAHVWSWPAPLYPSQSDTHMHTNRDTHMHTHRDTHIHTLPLPRHHASMAADDSDRLVHLLPGRRRGDILVPPLNFGMVIEAQLLYEREFLGPAQSPASSDKHPPPGLVLKSCRLGRPGGLSIGLPQLEKLSIFEAAWHQDDHLLVGRAAVGPVRGCLGLRLRRFACSSFSSDLSTTRLQQLHKSRVYEGFPLCLCSCRC